MRRNYNNFVYRERSESGKYKCCKRIKGLKSAAASIFEKQLA